MKETMCRLISQATRYHHWKLSGPFLIHHLTPDWNNTTGATSGAGTTYPSAAPELTPGI